MDKQTRERLKKQAEERAAGAAVPDAQPPLPPGKDRTIRGKIVKLGHKASQRQPAPLELRIIHTCGHAATVRDYAMQKCPKCLMLMRKKFAEERKAKMTKAGKVPTLKSRLPHDSEFAMKYDAATRKWTGTLTIPAGDPDAPDNRLVFEATQKAVINLHELLDGRYREYLKKLEAANAGRTGTPGPGGTPDGAAVESVAGQDPQADPAAQPGGVGEAAGQAPG